MPDVEFNPQDGGLAIVNGTLARERDTQSGRFLRTYQAQQALLDVVFSPDGSRLAGGSLAGSLEIWDARSGERLSQLSLQEGASNLLVWQVAYSPDGALLAAAGGDGSLYLIEAQTARLLANAQRRPLCYNQRCLQPGWQDDCNGQFGRQAEIVGNTRRRIAL